LLTQARRVSLLENDGIAPTSQWKEHSPDPGR
jgi:hypothetical protein